MLHLVRHGHAVSAEENRARPLSGAGRRQLEALARFFRANALLAPAELWHSPLARSRESAATLAAGLGWKIALKEVAGLEPDDDPVPLAGRLEALTEELVIVGHEPYLGRLATQLLAGTAAESAFVLQKGAALALERRDGRWRVRWLVQPSLLPPGDGA